MNQIQIRLFASLKDQAGQTHIAVELATPTTVAQLLAAVADQHPALAPALPSALVAINQAFADPQTTLQAEDEIALFPPVSGGAEEAFPYPTYFALAEEPPDLAVIQAHLVEPEVGAIVTFTGSVRGQTERDGLPPTTTYLEYEAYDEMAYRKMAQIAREIWAKWPLVRGIALVQRVGKLEVGQLTTFVACAAGHRDQGAFAAARYGIDRLKEIVPVWKKEVGPEQSIWIEGDYRPTEADNE